ncbi:peptide MFS transporter [Georgenia sp. SYP-B2076]|uniref:peptide MFS transporter n=1 Tax=Georgenia sp. SYP-B2076 TaxID=2495881 RepID=UPI000F8D964D|nr:peptide MFS transporter [Georgenia sp. SYP-B2076]
MPDNHEPSNPAVTGDHSPAPGDTREVPRNTAFFGHPLGLLTLFGTELWERFSYYGMRAILLFYLTDTVAKGGLAMEQTSGLALVSIYGTSVYLLSVVGGWLADRMIGARRSVLYGGIIIAAGHVLLTVPIAASSYLGIACVALGTGLLKPNVSSMVGELYDRGDPRRDGAFSIFYMGINLGSLAAPFLVGLARTWGGYHAGFAVAAVGMALALIFFVAGRRLLGGAGDTVTNPLQPHEGPAVIRWGVIGVVVIIALVAAVKLVTQGSLLSTFIDTMSILAFATPVLYFVVMYRSPRVTAHERSRVLAYIPLFVTAMIFWMIFEQAATTMAAFAENRTQLNLFGRTLPPELFQSINPALIVILAPVFAGLWVKLKGHPPTAIKFALGLGLAALSFLFLAGMSARYADTLAPAWVLGVTYLLQTLGELCLSPVGLAATTLLAPAAFRSQSMALWFLAPAAGQAITAQLVQVTEGTSDSTYFGGIGVVAMIFAIALLTLSPWVTRHIKAGAETVEEVELES